LGFVVRPDQIRSVQGFLLRPSPTKNFTVNVYDHFGPGNRFPSATNVAVVVLLLGVVVIRFSIY